MAVNKVVYGSNTLIDISDTTATAADVAQGKKFYLADGSSATGTSSGSGTDTLSALEADTLTSWTSTATSVRQYLFYGCKSLTSVSYPNATSIDRYAFQACSNLETVSFPVATSIGQYAFYGCSNLTSVSFPVVTFIDERAFQNCTKLASVSLNPSFNGYGSSNMFSNCASLAELDLKNGATISSNMFNGCTTLSVLVLRKSDAICSLSNTNAFTNTPFASGGTGGTLYVPQDLIASYQSANNWSTILGYANNQIKAIEGSAYE